MTSINLRPVSGLALGDLVVLSGAVGGPGCPVWGGGGTYVYLEVDSYESGNTLNRASNAISHLNHSGFIDSFTSYHSHPHLVCKLIQFIQRFLIPVVNW